MPCGMFLIVGGSSGRFQRADPQCIAQAATFAASCNNHSIDHRSFASPAATAGVAFSVWWTRHQLYHAAKSVLLVFERVEKK